MGYSIMTPFKNEIERDKMFAFIEKNYKPLSVLLDGKGKNDFYSDRVPTTDLGYRPNNKLSMIGFNYNCSHPESSYYFAICYWMSITYGRRHKFKEHKDMPYVNYDGCENWVLFVNTERDKSIESIEVDEYGFRSCKFKKDNDSIFMKAMALFEDKLFKLSLIDKVVKEELVRLTKLWEIEQNI